MARELSRAEQEVVISKCADEDRWTVYATDPVLIRRFHRILEHTGGKTSQHQGGTKFFLPAAELRIHSKQKRALSAEARKALVARLQGGRVRHQETQGEA